MEALFRFLKKNSFGIMMVGFGFVLVCVVVFVAALYLHPHDSARYYRPISLAAMSGFGVYVVGRILLALQRHDERRERIKETSSAGDNG